MRFAIDTNLLIDWAEGQDDVPACFEIIRERIPGVSIVVPPTVLHELGHFAAKDKTKLGRHALKALQLIREEPLLRPINLVPVGHGIVDVNAWKLREKGIIDEDEIHDSLVLAEAGLLECSVLLSNDSHLTAIDPKLLHEVMKDFDGSVPIIQSPRQIVRKFGGR
jgi:predicted nucleic acid-binding protein